MDRNKLDLDAGTLDANVATREGGVDRNVLLLAYCNRFAESPPARVAWIETRQWHVLACCHAHVATREGGVDRNTPRGV